MIFNVGGVTVSTNAPLVNDWIDVSNRSLKRMRFRITDARGKTTNLHNAPGSFTLLLSAYRICKIDEQAKRL